MLVQRCYSEFPIDAAVFEALSSQSRGIAFELECELGFYGLPDVGLSDFGL